MKAQLFLAFTLVGLSAAQSTTVSLFLPNTDQQGLVASVVGAVSNPPPCFRRWPLFPTADKLTQDATATTYALSCPPGTDANSCGYGGGATVIEGPSTLQLVLLSSSVPLETIACNLAGTTQAVCTISETLKGYSTSQVTTSTLGPADITFFPIGITAGAEKLGPASASGGATASRTAGESISPSTTTGLVGSISVAVSSTSGATASVTSTVSGSGETAATQSVRVTTGASSGSQTQAASSAASSVSNSALRTSEVQSSSLAISVSCVFAGALAVMFL
jgi:hypothetical protein